MVSLTDLITADLGLPADSRGRGSWWLCPFHDDKRPSLQVHEYKGREYYKCWACGAEGKAWEWLEGYRHLSKREVYAMLYGETGSPRPAAGRPGPRPAGPPAQWTPAPDVEWQEMAVDVCLEAAAALHSPRYAAVYKYLTGPRGLRPETIDAAGLGYNPSWREVRPGAKLPPGIVIPCLTDHDLWYVKVRLTRDEAVRTGQKYMALKGSQTASLYNAERLKAAAVGVVCEGEFDALLLQQEVPDVAAVTMGSATAGPSAHWHSYLSWLDRLLVILDEDTAGQKGLAKWQAAVSWCQVMRPPEGLPGKDVTDWHAAGLDLRQWVADNLRQGQPERRAIPLAELLR